MKKLILLLLIVSTGMWAQSQTSENKLSLSTQLFLDEQAGRISLTPPVSGPQKSPGNSSAPSLSINGKYDRPIAKAIDRNGRQLVSAFVRVTDRSARSALEALGVEIECEFLNGRLFTTLIPVDKVIAVSRLEQVRRVSVATQKRPLTNVARQKTNTDDVLTFSADAREAGLPDVFDGSGVVLGVIDTGIDFKHIAFKDKGGNSRIKRAYVYNGSSATEYTTIGSTPTTDDSGEDHGTHTSSTAGGSSVIINGNSTTVTDQHANATYGGMAPGADLYLAGIKNLNDTYLYNAFQKICDYADQQNKPVVVNNSWGSHFGPHDGTGEFSDLMAQYFGDNHPNHICLFASSNDAGDGGFSFTGMSNANNPVGTVIRWNSSYISYYYGILANAWTRAQEASPRCKIIVINSSGVAQTSVVVTPTANGTQVNGLSNYISNGSLTAYLDNVNNKTQIVLYTSGLQMSSGHYLAVQFYPNIGSTHIDVWPGNYTYFDSSVYTNGYNWTALTDNLSMSDESTCPDVISIGAYASRNSHVNYQGSTQNYSYYYTTDDIAPFSSYGTPDVTPTGEQYPWITAPGARLIAGVNHYSSSYINGSLRSDRANTDTSNPYAAMEGTSMATPVAAGIVALWLQAAQMANKSLTVNDVKSIMRESAITDNYTNGANRTHFGHGKINALAGIELILAGSVVKIVPTLSPVDTTRITHTSFRAEWADNTPAEEVSSYTLWVSKKPDLPPYALVYDHNFGSWSAVSSGWGTYTNIGNSLGQYGLAGWTGNYVYSYSGAMQIGRYTQYGTSYAGWLKSPTFDTSGYDGKITLVFNAKATRGGSTNMTIDVGDGSSTVSSKTISLNTSNKTYTVELQCNESAGSYIQLKTSQGYPVQLTDLKVYLGDYTAASAMPQRAAVEQGDSTSRTITGITDLFYTVNGLTGGGTFTYMVKALYRDNSESKWSNEEEVTLKAAPAGLLGDVNLDGNVDATDVNIMISIILGLESADKYQGRADIDGNGTTDVADVNLIVSSILGTN